MREYIVKLKPRTSFERLPSSDTLFGAICWAIRVLKGEEYLEGLLEEFNKKPPFIVSSIFPCNLKTDEYLLPKPSLKPLEPDELKSIKEEKDNFLRSKIVLKDYHSDKILLIELFQKYNKEFKKLKWIDSDYIREFSSSLSERKLFIDYLEGLIKQYEIGKQDAVQKNMLDRLSFSTSGAGGTFYNEEIFFRNNWGLYFLVMTEYFDELIFPALRFLEDSGIGSNARTGKNYFKVVDIKETDFTNSSEGDYFITLSRYLKNEDLDIANSIYSVLPVRSKVESREEFAGEDIWKSLVFYFSEGSLIKPKERKEFYGTIVPVKEVSGKVIYQYGYAYPLWINIGGCNEG